MKPRTRPYYKSPRKRGWTKEEIACLKKWYKHYSNRTVADILVEKGGGRKRKRNTINQKAYMLGLTKSKEYRRDILGHKI